MTDKLLLVKFTDSCCLNHLNPHSLADCFTTTAMAKQTKEIYCDVHPTYKKWSAA
jgi:hypothetical protein